MSTLRAIAAVTLFVCASTNISAQETALRWEFKKDRPFFLEITTDTTQAMKVIGVDVTQQQSQTFIYKWTLMERHKNKNWIVVQKVEAVKLEINIAGNKIVYDSSRGTETPRNAVAGFFKELVGSEYRFTISPEMKVLKVAGRDEFLAKLAKAQPGNRAEPSPILIDELLEQSAQQLLDMVPSKCVSNGDSWERKHYLNMVPIGAFETTSKYTYLGKQGKFNLIQVKTSLVHQPAGAEAQSSSPFKIKKAELRSQPGTGTILFDSQKCRLESSTFSVTAVGKLAIDIGGTISEVDFDQTQITSIRVFDQAPSETCLKTCRETLASRTRTCARCLLPRLLRCGQRGR